MRMNSWLCISNVILVCFLSVCCKRPFTVHLIQVRMIIFTSWHKHQVKITSGKLIFFFKAQAFRAVMTCHFRELRWKQIAIDHNHYHQLLAAKCMHFFTFCVLNAFSLFMRRHTCQIKLHLPSFSTAKLMLKHTDKASVTHIMCRLCTSLGCIRAKKLQ